MHAYKHACRCIMAKVTAPVDHQREQLSLWRLYLHAICFMSVGSRQSAVGDVVRIIRMIKEYRYLILKNKSTQAFRPAAAIANTTRQWPASFKLRIFYTISSLHSTIQYATTIWRRIFLSASHLSASSPIFRLFLTAREPAV